MLIMFIHSLWLDSVGGVLVFFFSDCFSDWL